jgi:hypothetical protein
MGRRPDGGYFLETGCPRPLGRPEQVGEPAPLGAQVGPSADALELPVRAYEGAEIGLPAVHAARLEHAQVPGGGVYSELGREDERAVPEGVGWVLEACHDSDIGKLDPPT